MSKSKQQPVVTGEREAQITALKAKYKDLLEPVKIEPVSRDRILATPSAHINDLTGKDQGIRQGSVVLWYGPQGSLKTWEALEMCREAQIKWPDKVIAYIDAEYRVDLYNATKAIGINTEPFDTGVPRLIYRRTNIAEDAWQMVHDFAKTGQFSMIVVDSVSALRMKKHVESGEMKIGQMGASARYNSDILPIVCPIVEETGTILWMISQERVVEMEPIVQLGPMGGAAPGFYSTHIFRSRRMPKVWEDPSRELAVWIEKNKYGLNLRKTTVSVTLGKGVNVEGDLIKYAEECGVIIRSGSHYYFGEIKLGQGLDNAASYLRENPDVLKKIREDLAKFQTESEDTT